MVGHATHAPLGYKGATNPMTQARLGPNPNNALLLLLLLTLLFIDVDNLAHENYSTVIGCSVK